MIAAARMSTSDWIAVAVIVSAVPVWCVVRVELERWRERRHARRRRGYVDVRRRS